MVKSKIEWTDFSWNPVIGCSKCSPGCLNCYAEKMALRLRDMGIYPYHQHPDLEPITKKGWTGIITCNEDALDKPLHWRKPRRIFVCSMSDLFHPKVPFEFILKIWKITTKSPRHTFQILTKRPKQMKEFAKWMAGDDDISIAEWPRNCWLGVSISTQKEDWKIKELLQIPAAIRFVSLEPMLEGIDFKIDVWQSYLSPCSYYCDHDEYGGGHRPQRGIDWVIVGGESGTKRRKCKKEWVDSIVEQCRVANVPCFVKQIHKDGKVVKMPTEYPQEFPK